MCWGAGDSIGGLDQLPAELNAAFCQIEASTSEQLENLITVEQTKLQCTLDTDSDVVQNFEATEKEIKEFEVAFENARKVHENLVEELTEKKSKWLPELERVISQVCCQSLPTLSGLFCTNRSGCLGGISRAL